ncbi:D-alanyl-D-alanine carboxypeptidase-like [Paramacrobiotus metropolitanus]|uniref:D-alanyl-D-alanine carboxypeptidase-like n=1 Tax=Paramacrobiotus metropolitanus TaxID=2943436 RepID=UPI00244570FF|nr:D-alanyl-D-alanine carboxypeptidase-like [Paramacrobiotus metropolitanus]
MAVGRLLFLIVTCFLVSVRSTTTPPTLVIQDSSGQNYTVDQRLQHYNIPGLSLAVIVNRTVAWAQAYGLADTATSRPVTTETLFQAASMSKPMAAFAALHFVETGQLSLDNDINGYLNADWLVPNSSYTTTEKVTLRRLTSHTAGLTVHGFYGYPRGNTVPTVVQVLQGTNPPANSPKVESFAVPGTKWQYSGGGYTVMQKAMVDRVGKPFPQIMNEEVFGKLGMTLSTYEQPLPAAREPEAATGYRENKVEVVGKWHTYPEMAAAGMWTTPSDYARYIIEVQNSLHGTSNKVISAAMTREMLTPGLGSYGLGPGTIGNTTDMFEHGGANEGFRCHFMASAVAGNGYVIMTNSDDGGKIVPEVAESIDRLIGANWPRPPDADNGVRRMIGAGVGMILISVLLQLVIERV